jgi:hypothetical protein
MPKAPKPKPKKGSGRAKLSHKAKKKAASPLPPIQQLPTQIKIVNEPSGRVESFLTKAESFFDNTLPRLVESIIQGRSGQERAEAELRRLQDRLVGILSKDQLEMAMSIGVTPANYAIEFVEIWKEKMWADVCQMLQIKSMDSAKA